MGLFDKFKKKKETELSFNELIADKIYDLKNNSNACTLSGGETEDGKIIMP